MNNFNNKKILPDQINSQGRGTLINKRYITDGSELEKVINHFLARSQQNSNDGQSIEPSDVDN